MADRIGELEGQRFDVAIIGGGINGASAARELSAAGYRCLLAEKDDFASGASGRSSRMLHCGLRYFETSRPVRDFALSPRRLLEALAMARQSMQARAEFVRECGPGTDGYGRRLKAMVKPFTMCFPVWHGGPVAGWQLAAGLRLLAALGPKDVPLGYRRLGGGRLGELPFLADLRAPGEIETVACYTEFVFDWPERFCIDAVLAAERDGAVVLNYCPAALGGRDSEGLWRIRLDGRVTVLAPVVLAMAGTWIDSLIGGGPPLVRGTKGAHIMVRMPDAYWGHGIATVHRGGHPFYLIPAHEDLFYFGPTETPFEGDASAVRATDTEIDFLIDEANHLLPGRRLTRRDVELSWAGVRPLTWHPDLPMGNRSRVLHDLGARGLDGVYALTAGPVMTHRSSGRLVRQAVSGRLPWSAPEPKPGGASARSDDIGGGNAVRLSTARPEVTAADVEAAARGSHARTLSDILVRRVGLAGRRFLERQEVAAVAAAVAPVLGWTEARVTDEVEAFLALQSAQFRRPGEEGGAD